MTVSLADLHDCLLLDLDGTVFRGHQPTEGAIETLAGIGSKAFYVTNNASRSPAQVAAHLQSIGFDAEPSDVVTSSQGAAHLLGQRLPAGARVLVVGTEALADEVRNVGLEPVRLATDDPVAVVQGFSPDIGWPLLAEAALAIRAGALWMATNIDRTLPSERGLVPGNGSLVAALQTATEQVPEVAGKPEPTLFRDALSRGSFVHPLAVGDRLDTDIAGANAAGLPSLLVLSGVSTAAEAVRAGVGQRPTYIAGDLRALNGAAAALRVAPDAAWQVTVEPNGATAVVAVHATGDHPADDLSVVRATASAVWGSAIDGHGLMVHAGDDVARQALERWSLLS